MTAASVRSSGPDRLLVLQVDPGAHLSGSPPEAMRLGRFGWLRLQGGSQEFRRQLAKGPAIALLTPFELVVDLGAVCEGYLMRHLVDLPATRIECDEIWAFCSAKARNVPEEHRDEWGYGDVWTWVALDPGHQAHLLLARRTTRRPGRNGVSHGPRAG